MHPIKTAITALLLTFASSALAAETLRFATAATYPPFESLNASNQIIGFDIDLARALCQQMQAECTFTNQSFDSLIPALRFKKFDAVIAGMEITPARAQQVAFSDPYYDNAAQVIALKAPLTSLDAFKGKRLGVENGTTHQRYLQDLYPQITSVPYDSYQNAFTDLLNGRLDGVLGDAAAVNHWAKSHPNLAAATPRIINRDYFGSGVGIAVRPGNTALLTRLNAALKAIKANGTYQKIAEKWSI